MLPFIIPVALLPYLQPADSAPADTPPLVCNVREFGAKGDGSTDNTDAFQKALDTAAKGGGGVVVVPAGRYAIKGHLSVPPAVTLQGTWQAPPSHTGIRDANGLKPEYGSVLLAYEGAGKEDGPAFITLGNNSTLRGFVIYYPEQDPSGPPQPYPWTIQMRGNNPTVENVELLNPYQAIDARQNQRHLIRNVHGQPLRRGVWIEDIYDIGRVENVHFNPWWSMKPRLFEWQMANGEAFIIGRSDWQYVLNTFCYGYKVGYRFIQSARGVCNGNFLGIGADDCLNAVVVEQSAPMALLITNGEFVSFRGPEPIQVVVGPKHSGSVRFVNCAFWGPNKQIARIEGAGTVGFSDCTFMQWDKDREGRPAIEALGGTLIVRGCEFRDGRKQISIGPNVRRAVITGNVIAGSVQISNESRGSVVISNNAAEQ
ncbi:MAG: glycosyl hydrolase family 28-related protein [Armatimonadota bacterium]